MNDWRATPHRRYDPLLDRWVLVSPHRLARPWQGESAPSTAQTRPAYDPLCYLCPGNERANGKRNPRYEQTFAFENDFAALVPDVPEAHAVDPLLRAQSERGTCRVLCFSPHHDLDVAKMSVPQIRGIVDAWALQYAELRDVPYVNVVTIFENRGAMMGASNPHPHGQIWANASVPNDVATETRMLRKYRSEHDACLLCAYASRELEVQERVIFANEHVCVAVPFWAVWPFEALVIPRAHVRSIDDLSGEQRDALAEAMQALTSRYDRLFDAPFPYSMGLHQQPADGAQHDEWHLHVHYFPPLLRSASIRKYMVGYELLAQPQRDLTPEEAAQQLARA